MNGAGAGYNVGGLTTRDIATGRGRFDARGPAVVLPHSMCCAKTGEETGLNHTDQTNKYRNKTTTNNNQINNTFANRGI